MVIVVVVVVVVMVVVAARRAKPQQGNASYGACFVNEACAIVCTLLLLVSVPYVDTLSNQIRYDICCCYYCFL